MANTHMSETVTTEAVDPEGNGHEIAANQTGQIANEALNTESWSYDHGPIGTQTTLVLRSTPGPSK